MYNIDFLEQTERSRRFIFGNRCREDPRGMPPIPYVPSKDVELLECYENERGEWVPKLTSESKLEKGSQ